MHATRRPCARSASLISRRPKRVTQIEVIMSLRRYDNRKPTLRCGIMLALRQSKWICRKTANCATVAEAIGDGTEGPYISYNCPPQQSDMEACQVRSISGSWTRFDSFDNLRRWDERQWYYRNVSIARLPISMNFGAHELVKAGTQRLGGIMGSKLFTRNSPSLSLLVHASMQSTMPQCLNTPFLITNLN